MKPDGEDLADWIWIIAPLPLREDDVPRSSGWYSGQE